jgi:DNA-binding transcriptional MerR regulator
MAIPRLAEQIGVTPRVLRYWEQQQLISPTREHGKLRYSPRDLAIAALIRRLLDAGAGVEGIRMLKRLAERDVRHAAAAGAEDALAEEALRILYQRKAFSEEPAPTRSTTLSVSRPRRPGRCTILGPGTRKGRPCPAAGH